MMAMYSMQLPSLNVLLIALGAYCAYIAFVCTYNIFFHPLRKFPGPLLATVTDQYHDYHRVIKVGNLVRQLEKLHQRYGPVVRIAPNTLHFSDPRAHAVIYAPGSKFTKDPGYYLYVFRVEHSSFGTIDPVFAKKRRDVIASSFSRRAVLKLEHLVQEKVSKLISNLAAGAKSGTVVDLRKTFRSFSLDVITEYAFAQCTNTLDDPARAGAVFEDIDAQAKTAWLKMYMPSSFLQFLLHLPPRYQPRNIRALAGLMLGLERQVDYILADPASLDKDVPHEIIYHQLLARSAENASDEQPTRTSLIQEAQVMITAGSDTTATACMGGTYYVLKDPAVREKLVKELTEAWPDLDIPMTYAKLERLPYLTAVIKESLRTTAGVITPLWRVAPQDTDIVGYHTVVATGVTFVHFNAEIFPEPFEFKPERWLGPDSGELEPHLVPFSKGPRSCVAVNLAWSEIYLLLANIFRKLDLQLSESATPKLEFLANFLAIPVEGTNVDAHVGGLRT